MGVASCGLMLLQLADFGLSRVMETNATHISTNTIGTIAYQPEEVTTSLAAAFVVGSARTGQTAWMTGCL